MDLQPATCVPGGSAVLVHCLFACLPVACCLFSPSSYSLFMHRPLSSLALLSVIGCANSDDLEATSGAGGGGGATSAGVTTSATGASGSATSATGATTATSTTTTGATTTTSGSTTTGMMPTCVDGVQNGAETGVDCGGGACPGCGDGDPCSQASDCSSSTCVSNVCVACGGTGEPCCPGGACDALPNTCATNTLTLWGGTTAECNCGLLRAGQVLNVDQGRWSCDGRFFLVMQSDGNLVLYYSGVGALWSSNTAGTPANHAVMQGDGNFVVYDGASQAWWSSGTTGAQSAFLAVQNDGNVVVYDGSSVAWWATDTCCY